MIVTKGRNETWLDTVHRYAELEGVKPELAGYRYGQYLFDGYTERRAAFLALADFGATGAEEG